MSIDAATVRKVARLARIRLGDGEAESLSAELSGILTWIEQLNEVDVEGVAPMASTEAVKLPLREDVVTDGGDPARVLANAPKSDRGFFVVPKVVE
jgi:aspartyl-tRNA(Asn)/glutamyl-tRNA(Gln) amidotransferase subunit C